MKARRHNVRQEYNSGTIGWILMILPTRPALRIYVAADFSDSAVAKGKHYSERRTISGIGWAVSDIQSLPLDDGIFDTVISCETIGHGSFVLAEKPNAVSIPSR